MHKEFLEYKNPKKGGVYMFKGLVKLSCALALALFLLLPSGAQAGIPGDLPAPWISHQNTETKSWVLYSYWDLRDRETLVQVTNPTPFNVAIHVQVFDSNQNCLEFDFQDTLTGFDTHVYNLRSLDRNNGVPLAAPDLSNGYGFVAISVVTDVAGCIISDEEFGCPFDPNLGLIGNFRIIDDAGYEYRTNSVGISRQELFAGDDDDGFLNFISTVASGYHFNFNSISGTPQFSDVVGIPSIISINPTTGVIEVFAGSPIFAGFRPVMYDTIENPISCPQVAFACAQNANFIRDTLLELTGLTATVGFNLGVNQAIPNSRGSDPMCLGTDPAGWMDIDNLVFFFDPAGQIIEPFLTVLGNFFVGFVGLNNGSDRGSMDSWWHRACVADVKDFLDEFSASLEPGDILFPFTCIPFSGLIENEPVF